MLLNHYLQKLTRNMSKNMLKKPILILFTKYDMFEEKVGVI